MEILTRYKLNNLTHLDTDHLRTICPALLNQAVLPNCSLAAGESKARVTDHGEGVNEGASVGEEVRC